MPGGICQWTSNQCIVDTLHWDWEPLFRTCEFSKYFIYFQSDKFCSTNYDSSNMYNMQESIFPPYTGEKWRSCLDISTAILKGVFLHWYFKNIAGGNVSLEANVCLSRFNLVNAPFFPSSSILPNCCGLGLLFQPKNIHPICFLSSTRWTTTSATCTCHHEPHLEPK